MLDKWRLGPVVDIMNGSLMVLSADIFCYPGWWAKVFRTYPLNNPLHMVLIRAFLDLEMVGAPKQGQGNEVMKRGNQPVQQNDFHLFVHDNLTTTTTVGHPCVTHSRNPRKLKISWPPKLRPLVSAQAHAKNALADIAAVNAP